MPESLAIVFRRSARSVLELSAPVAEQLGRYRQVKPTATEAGGVLLGRWLVEKDDVIIDQATEPCEADRRGRFSFVRRREPAQRQVDAAWTRSGQIVQYLGEWHTHPEPHPTPSAVDLRDWQKILRRAHFETESLFFAIVGLASIGVWEGRKRSQHVIQLGVIDALKMNRHT